MSTRLGKGLSMLPSHVSFYETLSSQHQLARIEYVRLRILLLSHSMMNNTAISQKLDISLNTVRNWRAKWLSGYDYLCSLSGSEMERYLEDFVKDAFRKGAPKKFTLSQENALIALACDCPRSHGIQMTDWTLEMLSKVAVTQGIVTSISTSQLSRLLKKEPITTS